MLSLSIEEYRNLSTHLYKKPLQNMHIRKAKQVHGERVFDHAIIMKAISPSLVLCHCGGPEVDFEFEIRKTKFGAQSHITRNAGSLPAALEILEKMNNAIAKRIETDSGDNHPVNYSEGEYYVNRARKGRITAAHQEVLGKNYFPKAFLDNAVNWDFIIIKGQPKKKNTPKRIRRA